MQNIFDLVPVGLYRSSLGGRMLAANAATARLLGYPSVEALLEVNTADLYVDRGDRQRLLAMLQSGRDGRVEVRLKRYDGSTFWAEIWARLVDGEPEPFLAGMLNDVTSRRETENTLRENENLLRRVFDQLPIGAAVVSLNGRFHRVNAALCRMLGRSEAELRELTFLDITHPDDRPESLAAVRKLMNGEIDHLQLEKRYLRKDGEPVWGEVSVRMIRDASGQPIWTMPVVIDMTERRRLEEQLRHAQKMEAVGQLAGGIAHDFNNILTAIVGYSEMLLEQVGSDKQIFSDLKQIYDGGLRAAALTRQLLAFSRKQVLRLEVADLNQVLSTFQHLARPLIGEDVELELDLAQNPLPIFADVSQLEQVVMNLVVNARDALPHGGRITIRTAGASIGEEFARMHPPMSPGRYIELIVQDTGCGMDEETRRHLFEPFFTTKEPGKGTGLGLATVFGIIQQMGGFIWVNSEPNVGTEFRIHLPRSTRPLPGPREHVEPNGGPVGREQIMLVEDDRDVRKFAATVLRRFGYRVTEASTGGEALERLRTAAAPPDLVITDVVMPGMSGPELARRLTTERTGVKVLFTSGYAGHRIAPEGVLQDGMALLEKPFTANTLLTRVRDVLDV